MYNPFPVEMTPLGLTPPLSAQVRITAHLNVEKLKTQHPVSLHQGHSDFSLLFHKKIHKHTPNYPTHIPEKLTRTHSHLFPWRFVKPCLNSPITMTTTLSLPAVPVGGFRPAFSNFTLCGYLHSVITIPSILIFPVQTMCPGYTHTHKKKISSLCTHIYTH